MNRPAQKFFEWWKEKHNDFSGILFDIDGTLISGKHALSGAPELISWLRSHEYPFYLLTNDGNHSRQQKSLFLCRAGVNVNYEEIISCASALESYAENNALKGSKVFVLGELGNPDYAEDAGLLVTRDLKEINDVSAIIVGEGEYDWQPYLTAALNYFVKNREAPLVVPNPDSYWPAGRKGEFGIGAGGKARFLVSLLDEMGIEKKPVYLGKPYKAIYEYAVEAMRRKFTGKTIHFERVLMLGDSLRSDILGANTAGLSSALLLTGITGHEQLKKASGDLLPDYVFDSIA